jgi:hypothetical protein
MYRRNDWNRDCLPVRAETPRTARHAASRGPELVYGDGRFPEWSARMSFANADYDDGTVEQCIDELNDFLAGLSNYSPTVLAVALRVHLETLLQSLLEVKVCTREEVRELVRELEREALQYGED